MVDPTWQSECGTVKLWRGDCLECLRAMPAASVHCCVTSPPYFGLRDYGVEGQIGLEPSIHDYVAAMVGVFREVWRVLRDDGTFWLNLGDSYNNTGSSRNGEALDGKRRGGFTGPGGMTGYKKRDLRYVLRADGVKVKDLCGIPWRVALALQADGWTLRQDIIWHKPNPMPESVRDRCTKAHEYVFLLSKGSRYYYDAEAIKEEATYAGQSRGGSTNRYQQNAASMDCREYAMRNRRSVWAVNPATFKGAHFAVFPEALVEPCILAGTSEEGCCEACGAPWVREVEMAARSFESGSGKSGNPINGKQSPVQGGGETGDIRRGPVVSTRTTGWRAGCDCNAPTVPCVVLDPFAGSGTTAAVAQRYGRHAMLCELNPDYADLIKRRCEQSQRVLFR